MRLRGSVLIATLLVLTACSSTGSLDYTPTGPVAPGPAASVSGVTAVDRRDEKPNRFATVRGGFGNPFYVRDTPRPVAEEVADAFAKGLKARGMLAPSGNAPYRIQLVLRKLYGNKYVSRNAYIDIDLMAYNHLGQLIYEDTVSDKRDEFELFDASIADLEKLVQALLNATVDRMLDNPKLRAALRRPGRGPGV